MTRAAGTGSWQGQGTLSSGHRVLSCPQQHGSGTTEAQKGQEVLGVLCVAAGIQRREVQCRASRHTHGTARAWGTHPTARIVTACAQGQLPRGEQGTQVSDTAVRKELEEVSARASLTFSQELHLN